MANVNTFAVAAAMCLIFGILWDYVVLRTVTPVAEVGDAGSRLRIPGLAAIVFGIAIAVANGVVAALS